MYPKSLVLVTVAAIVGLLLVVSPGSAQWGGSSGPVWSSGGSCPTGSCGVSAPPMSYSQQPRAQAPRAQPAQPRSVPAQPISAPAASTAGLPSLDGIPVDASAAMDDVCLIFLKDGDQVTLGTGSLIAKNAASDEAIVITASHNIRDLKPSTRFVVFYPKDGQFAASVVLDNAADDIALLKTKSPQNATVRNLATREPVVGDPAAWGGFAPVSSNGRIVAYKFEYLKGTVQSLNTINQNSPGTSMEISNSAGSKQGWSGGPIVDRDGNLSGVVWGTGSGSTLSRVIATISASGSDTAKLALREMVPVNNIASSDIQVQSTSKEALACGIFGGLRDRRQAKQQPPQIIVAPDTRGNQVLQDISGNIQEQTDLVRQIQQNTVPPILTQEAPLPEEEVEQPSVSIWGLVLMGVLAVVVGVFVFYVVGKN